jgi:hypothetical protein
VVSYSICYKFECLGNIIRQFIKVIRYFYLTLQRTGLMGFLTAFVTDQLGDRFAGFADSDFLSSRHLF